MAPPLLLFCDTDCLIQLFVSDKTSLLKWARYKCGLAPVIVPEVQAEITWHLKFKDKFDARLRKALTAGSLSIFDYSSPDALSEFFPVGVAAASASEAISRTGREYALRLGRGEAYSHAVCSHLGMPFLSHDVTAIDALRAGNLKTAAPVLRVFDLIVLAHRDGEMSVRDIKNFRQQLQAWNSSEWMPNEFKAFSVAEGLVSYVGRLHRLAADAGEPPACQRFDHPLYLRPI